MAWEQKYLDKVKELNITDQELLDAEKPAESAWNAVGMPKWSEYFNRDNDGKAHYLVTMVVAMRTIKGNYGI